MHVELVELSNKATRAEVKASPGKKCFGNLLANQEEDEGGPGGRAWQEGRPNQVRLISSKSPEYGDRQETFPEFS